MGKKQLFKDFPDITTSVWEEKIHADLKGADYQKKLVWKSDEGIPVKPYYREEDLDGLEYLESIGAMKNPTEAPNGWLICQEIFPGKNTKEANSRIRSALKGGAQAIRIQLPQGKVPDLKLLKELLRDIPLGETELHFHGCMGADALYDSLCSLAASKGLNPNSLHGSLGADPLGTMAKTGLHIGSLENIGKLAEKVKTSSPGMRVIEVQGALIQNAGATLVEELAFAMAMASEYMEILTSRNIDPLSAQDSLQLVLSSGSNYFMEIAKIRAARILWATIATAYGIDASEAKIAIHSISSEWNMTLYDPHANMLRGTTEAMSSILGGADMVSVLPYDYPYDKGSEFSDRIARNVQIILREESHFDRVADPSSGAYYIENLSDSIGEKAWELFRETELKGGFQKAFETGWIQELVLASRRKKADRAASGKGRILGTNSFPNFDELILRNLDATVLPEEGDENLSDITPLKPFRLSEQFESVRLRTERSKKRPRVLLLKLGKPAWMTARATFAGNFFACAGYEIINPTPFDTAEGGIAFARSNDFDIVVLCSSDDAYDELAPAVQKALGGKSIVVVAGYPADSIESLQKAGIKHFVHMKSNLLETLNSFNDILL